MARKNKALPRIIKFTFEGKDKKGIISSITSFFFQNQCNILDIDQRILEGTLIMSTLVDCSDVQGEWQSFIKGLEWVVFDKLGMRYRMNELCECREKRIGLLVTREHECPEAILAACKAGKINGQVAVIIGNHDELVPLAKKYKVPFLHVSADNRKKHEAGVLAALDEYQADLVVLARYMQILSPEFVFRHEGRIINIHPSLLPAFPGPRSYHQAFNKGVDIVGVTAHFVTTDLDEGPIIAQDCFRVNRRKDQVEDYIKRGRVLEAKVLVRAIKLYCDDELSLRRGKVVIGRHEHEVYARTKAFYCETVEK